ncbi:MAG TPA: hypothetical protein VFA04_14450 [Bryobacteraceae bacterium]|nr:hypothetical protein [Bryobacteraceae bacterium]
MEMSWLVTGVQHDEWARQHPMTVEVQEGGGAVVSFWRFVRAKAHTT